MGVRHRPKLRARVVLPPDPRALRADLLDYAATVRSPATPPDVWREHGTRLRMCSWCGARRGTAVERELDRTDEGRSFTRLRVVGERRVPAWSLRCPRCRVRRSLAAERFATRKVAGSRWGRWRRRRTIGAAFEAAEPTEAPDRFDVLGPPAPVEPTEVLRPRGVVEVDSASARRDALLAFLLGLERIR